MKKLNGWITLFIYPAKKTQHLLVVGLIILTILITAIVYLTGGIQYVYSHGMYIPILIAGIYFGIYGGLIQGLIGGLLLGPFMPIDTETMAMQTPINWLYRVIFFMLIGGIIGYFSRSIKRTYLARIDMLKKDINTGIPLFTNLLDDNIVDQSEYIMHLKILNHQDLIDLLGIDAYYRLVKTIHKRMLNLKSTPKVYQKELSSFIITLDTSDKETSLKQISKTLKETFTTDNVPVYIDTALGITEGKTNIQQSLSEAMYASRYAERNYVSTAEYSKSMTPDENNINILGLFSEALRSDELYLVFQPQIDLKTGEVVGAESLIRWQSDELGLMKPKDFIPLVEDTSLVNDLTEWVIKSAFERIKVLMQSHIPIKIAINISAKNLLNEDFYTNVRTWLEDYQIPGQYVEFEITEQSLMQHKGISEAYIDKLKHEKISLSVDDFGTGYSSLNELNRYQINTIKIDQSFVHKCNENTRLCSITRAAVSLGESLSIKSTAEGVETKAEVDFLSSIGCDYGQGNYYSKPLQFDAFYSYLKDHKKHK